MNELEQYLTEFSVYVDVWTDDEGLHVHDWIQMNACRLNTMLTSKKFVKQL